MDEGRELIYEFVICILKFRKESVAFCVVVKGRFVS